MMIMLSNGTINIQFMWCYFDRTLVTQRKNNAISETRRFSNYQPIKRRYIKLGKKKAKWKAYLLVYKIGKIAK